MRAAFAAGAPPLAEAAPKSMGRLRHASPSSTYQATGFVAACLGIITTHDLDRPSLGFTTMPHHNTLSCDYMLFLMNTYTHAS